MMMKLICSVVNLPGSMAAQTFMPPELHADVVASAKSKGESLNQFITETLDQAVHS